MTTDERLERLERQLQVTKRRGLVLLLVAFVAVVVAFTLFLRAQGLRAQGQQDVTDVSRARRFEVVDANGKTRIGFSVGEDGMPGLRLFDASNKARIGLGVDNDGTSALGLSDVNGKPRIAITTLARLELGLYDTNGKMIWAAR